VRRRLGENRVGARYGRAVLVGAAITFARYWGSWVPWSSPGAPPL
jgi:hypothetical protein